MVLAARIDESRHPEGRLLMERDETVEDTMTTTPAGRPSSTWTPGRRRGRRRSAEKAHTREGDAIAVSAGDCR